MAMIRGAVAKAGAGGAMGARRYVLNRAFSPG